MKFLKGMMARKREDAPAETPPAISIETLQADLDHSGLDRALRDPDSAWSEKAAQRPGGEPVAASETDHAQDDAAEPAAAGRAVSRDLEWDEELGDAGDASLREAFDAPRARRQTRPVAEDDFTASDDGFDEFDDDDGFDDDEFDELEPEEEQAIRDNALLVEEIRDAIAAVRHIETDDPKAAEPVAKARAKGEKGWEEDEEFGRKALARHRLARLSESADGDRILEETNTKMYDDDAANRRRQAMAHLKAAAAATKADLVLKRVVGRDPAIDPDEQVQYREDLANVVRQRGPRSEPISRPLSRPRTRPLSTTVTAEPAAAVAPVAAALTEPAPHDPLQQAFSQPAEMPGATAPTPETLPEDNEPAEATMDVEKIDLKTALERQKAILKAEREALEAEIAAETGAKAPEPGKIEPIVRAAAPVAPAEPEDFEEDEAPEHEVSAGPVAIDEAEAELEDEPEFEPEAEIEPEFEAEAEAEDEPEFEEETAGQDDWDSGMPHHADGDADDDGYEDDDAEGPVDVTAHDGGEDETGDADQHDADEDDGDSEADEDRDEDGPELDLELETSEAAGDDAEGRDDTAEVTPAAAPRRAGRVKTRLLGFQSKSDNKDVFAGKAATGGGPVRFPVGWLVVTEGDGFGHSFSLLSGVSKIGRGDDQAVQLDFGDTSISRDNHAAVAFDEELNQFFLGHGGKSNVVRLNGKPVLSTEELYDGDEIRIGETTLKFIALCCEDFTWSENAGDDNDHARSA